jgi:hypothetical protein
MVASVHAGLFDSGWRFLRCWFWWACLWLQVSRVRSLLCRLLRTCHEHSFCVRCSAAAGYNDTSGFDLVVAAPLLFGVCLTLVHAFFVSRWVRNKFRIAPSSSYFTHAVFLSWLPVFGEWAAFCHAAILLRAWASRSCLGIILLYVPPRLGFRLPQVVDL